MKGYCMLMVRTKHIIKEIHSLMSCQIQQGSPTNYISIGKQDSAVFVADDKGGLTLQYSDNTDTLRTTYITLVCNATQDPGTFTAIGEDPHTPVNYDMTYTGTYACPVASPSGGGTGGLSVGTIICIAFCALLIVYIAVGVAFQVFIRKASGKEMIPQSSLWLSVPGLIKVCQIQPGNPNNYFDVGLQDTASFATDQGGAVTLSYNDKTSTKRTTHLALVCDQSQDPGTFTAQGEVSTATYHMIYTGKYACPRSGPPITTTPSTPGGPGGISVGSILCITVFTIVIVYFVAGILIQRFVRKASGKEMIPQYTIWAAGPGIIKDGVLFVVRCGKQGKGYSNI